MTPSTFWWSLSRSLRSNFLPSTGFFRQAIRRKRNTIIWSLANCCQNSLEQDMNMFIINETISNAYLMTRILDQVSNKASYNECFGREDQWIVIHCRWKTLQLITWTYCHKKHEPGVRFSDLIPQADFW